MKRLIIVLLGCVWFTSATAADDGLIAQLATDHVDITTHFTGEHILFFGALTRPGDVVIKIASPAQTVAMSRKVKTGPVWLSNGKLTLEGTPGLMYLLSSKPLRDILPEAEAARYGLSLQAGFEQGKITEATPGFPNVNEAFLRLKQEKSYYQQVDNSVTLISNRLFFTRLALPAKLPLGSYQIEVYLVRDGKVVSHRSSQLDVRQVSAELWVSNIAYRYPWVYGVAFTLLAILIGLSLGMWLRRDKDD